MLTEDNLVGELLIMVHLQQSIRIVYNGELGSMFSCIISDEVPFLWNVNSLLSEKKRMSPQWNNIAGYASVVTHLRYCSVTSHPSSLLGAGFPSGTSASKAERFLHVSKY